MCVRVCVRARACVCSRLCSQQPVVDHRAPCMHCRASCGCCQSAVVAGRSRQEPATILETGGLAYSRGNPGHLSRAIVRSPYLLSCLFCWIACSACFLPICCNLLTCWGFMLRFFWYAAPPPFLCGTQAHHAFHSEEYASIAVSWPISFGRSATCTLLICSCNDHRCQHQGHVLPAQSILIAQHARKPEYVAGHSLRAVLHLPEVRNPGRSYTGW